MKLHENFENDTWDEYQIYLETQGQQEEFPMTYEAFEWLKVREIQNHLSEMYEDSYEHCI